MLFIDLDREQQKDRVPVCVQILCLIRYCGKPQRPSSLLGLNGTGEEP